MSKSNFELPKNWKELAGILTEAPVLGKGMSADARARDVEQSDREYIAQKQKRNANASSSQVSNKAQSTSRSVCDDCEDLAKKHDAAEKLHASAADAIQKKSLSNGSWQHEGSRDDHNMHVKMVEQHQAAAKTLRNFSTKALGTMK